MRFRFARLTALVLLGLAEAAAATVGVIAATAPAAAQIDDRFPFMEDRRRRYQQQGPWGYQEQRQAPADSSRAPAPRRSDTTPTTKIVVFGDSMADWLAYGLEDAFGETPEIGILRKHRASTGLIRTEVRGESYDWPSQAREMLNAEKPDFIVMMIGLADRRGIREAIRQPQPARPPAGQKQQPPAQPAATQPAQPGQPAQQQAAAPATAAQPAQAAPPVQPTPPAKPTDAEAPPPDTQREAAQD